MRTRDKLRSAVRKPVSLVPTEPEAVAGIPQCISLGTVGRPLEKWFCENRKLIHRVLLEKGAVLFRRARVEPARDPSALVGPFTMEVAISHSDKIHSFTEPLSPEVELEIRQRLIADATLKTQWLLTDRLSRQDGFAVTSLHEAKRIEVDLAPPDTPMALDLMLAMGRAAGVDLVLFGRILGYGQLPLRYWLTGWAATASSQLAVVGAATGGNPVAMGSYFGFDILTDLPLWTGGFYAFGWAFRPVLVEVEAWQLMGCEQRVWQEREFALLGHAYLAAYPERERKKKEVQLESNLVRVTEELARRAGESLRLQSCPESTSTSAKTAP